MSLQYSGAHRCHSPFSPHTRKADDDFADSRKKLRLWEEGGDSDAGLAGKSVFSVFSVFSVSALSLLRRLSAIFGEYLVCKDIQAQIQGIQRKQEVVCDIRQGERDNIVSIRGLPVDI